MVLSELAQLKFATCDIMAYDDRERIAFFRLDGEVYELSYDFLNPPPATEHQLKRIIKIAGRIVWAKASGTAS